MYLIENEYKRNLAAKDSIIAAMRKDFIAEQKALIVKEKALIAEQKAHTVTDKNLQKVLSENAKIKAKLAELERRYRPNWITALNPLSDDVCRHDSE